MARAEMREWNPLETALFGSPCFSKPCTPLLTALHGKAVISCLRWIAWFPMEWTENEQPPLSQLNFTTIVRGKHSELSHYPTSSVYDQTITLD
nr:hypothetical protein BgiMline_018194 [Biomphalaria glabrata]